MKRLTQLTLTLTIVLVMVAFAATNSLAQEATNPGNIEHGSNFVDANGDGYNDNAPDHDDDGIPNGQDPDYVGGVNGKKHGFIDEDGDGINDNAPDHDGDGIPNGQDQDYVRAQDGSGRGNGYGNGMKGSNSKMGTGTGLGSAECDESGPKSNGRRGSNK